MKKVYNKGLGVTEIIPETPLEAVEQLEEFLISDWGQSDWGPKFLSDHFDICKNLIKNIQKGGKNMENTQTKFEKTTKKVVDTYIDGEGRFHKRIIVDTVSSPMNLNQATRRTNLVLPRVVITRRQLPPGILPFPKQRMKTPCFGDINSFMQMGRKFLEDNGINLKEVFEDLTSPEEETIETVEPTREQEAKAKEELNKILAPENKSLRDQKEVKDKKWQKKTNKQKIKQNQKIKKKK